MDTANAKNVGNDGSELSSNNGDTNTQKELSGRTSDVFSSKEEQVSQNCKRSAVRVRPSLNTVVLLQILSHCDAHTVCRFSRSCRWAKEFVDSNFRRLPQLDARLSAAYRLGVFHYMLFFPSTFRPMAVHSELCDVEAILTQARYAFISYARVDCCGISAVHGRRLFEQLCELNCDEFSFRLQAPGIEPHGFGNQIIIHANKADAVLKDHMRNLVDMPFEVICSNVLPVETNKDVARLLDLTFRWPFLSKLYFYGTPLTMLQSITLLISTLKPFEDTSEPFGEVSMKFVIRPGGFLTSTDTLSVLKSEMQRCGMLQHFDFEAPQVRGQFAINAVKKNKAYAIHLAVLDREYIHELPPNPEDLLGGFIQHCDKWLMICQIVLERLT